MERPYEEIAQVVALCTGAVHHDADEQRQAIEK